MSKESFFSFFFRGPLTRSLEEEDYNTEDESSYVPNGNTVRVKVYLPNKHPIWVILKRDATVQDTIEKTIRKANALSGLYQKKLQELKDQRSTKEEAKEPKVELNSSGFALSPPLDESPPENGISGFSEFLDPTSTPEAEEESVVSESEMRAIPGYDVMPLIADSMAYELRIEMENGECDLDFPGRNERRR